MARVCVIPDLHIPFHHEKAKTHILKTAERWRCHRFISLGDICDFNSYSKWDPDPTYGHSPGREYELLMEDMQKCYRDIPELDIIESNHDSRPWKRLFQAKLPIQFAKSISEFLHSPPGWKWINGNLLFEGVTYTHGEGLTDGSWHKAYERFRTSVCSGHLHSVAGVAYNYVLNKRYFSMNCGALIDEKIFPMKNKTIDDKWNEVREFYEKYYRIKFRQKLDDIVILSLWDKMKQVSRELTLWSETPRPLMKSQR